MVLAYTVGRQVGLRDLQTNQMKFLKNEADDCNDFIEVTALGFYSKKYIAVGYIKQNDKKAYIAVHKVKNYGANTELKVTIDLFDEVPAYQR